MFHTPRIHATGAAALTALPSAAKPSTLAELAAISASCVFPTLAVALASLLLAACDQDDKTVAVKVNTEEITVNQLENELARLRGLSEEQRKTATMQSLDRLVDQALLVQRALDRKLDRDPRMVQAIEASRRQILARGYLESVTAQAARPSPDNVAKFYADHPELFAERKIYRLQELAIAPHPELTTARVEEVLKKAKSLNEVVEWLKRRKLSFNANSTVKAAEQLPMEIVPRLTALKRGQAMLVPALQGYLIVQTAAAELQPLTEAQARPFIEQFLTNQKRRELEQAEIRALRSDARIEYVGKFAPVATIAPGSAALHTASPTAPAEGAAPAAGKSAIERNVKEL